MFWYIIEYIAIGFIGGSLVWFNGLSRGWNSDDAIILDEVPMLTDFYHKNHIDYRGLIPKGLAVDATDKNIY